METLNLYPQPKSTLEVMDDAPPDSTPREMSSEEEQRAASQKAKRAQLLKLEQMYRSLNFKDESKRVKNKTDTFSATESISLKDIEKEKARLQGMQEASKRKALQNNQDVASRTQDLKQDRAALTVQALYRGHLGRRRMSLVRYLQAVATQDEMPSDWVQIADETTGDVWYYDKTNNVSQWEKPAAMKSERSAVSQRKSVRTTAPPDPVQTKSLIMSMSLPTLAKVNSKKPVRARSVLAASMSEKSELLRERAAQQDINKELKIIKLDQKDALLAPDGSFKPQLRTVVQDALLDTRFDNVSTVLSDQRWFDKNDEAFVAMDQVAKSKLQSRHVESRLDLNKTPMVAQLNICTKKAAQKVGMLRMEPGAEDGVLVAPGGTTALSPSDLTLNNIAHNGFDQADQGAMCFGCWSAGFSRKCTLHDDGSKIKPSQTMLLCRNWDLDVMRRRYRSEEIQEIFLQQESSLRFDVKHKKFYTVVEQRHPIYRLCSQQLEVGNNRMLIFCKVKYWMLSMAEEFRQGNVAADKEDKSRIFRLRRGLLHLSRIHRFTATNKSLLPLPPITGYSWAERLGRVQHLFKHLDSASGQEVDIIISDPLPVPKELYKAREYHLSLPKTFPLPRPGAKVGLSSDPNATLPGNIFIPDLSPSAWVERICSATASESMEFALGQIKALTPVTPLEVQTRSKRPAPTTMKFATIGNKPTPGNLAVGGLPVEMLVYQIISTYFPPQYGAFMVMDKGSISPGVSPEVTISFKSLLMPPTQEPYVERPLEHALNYRRVPTIGLNSNISADDKYYYGRNRPEQTGEQDPHGFRTATWAPQLMTIVETDPQVFVPGQSVASLNDPKANLSYTTHADASYPFCEPSTRDNSTLDFYHLLLNGVISVSKAQVFTALTVQEPGAFQKSYRLDQPLGHLVASVYRSWAYRQQDTIQEFKTDDGVSYWYHRKTGQTFWERPRQAEEEVSPLQGGIVLDMDHAEEPMMISRGEAGLERRYDQGEFRDIMLNHLESKKEAVARRKAAAVTVRNARERGTIPPLLDLNSTANLPAASFDNVLEDGVAAGYSQSMIPNSEPSSQLQLDALGSTHDLMQYYAHGNDRQGPGAGTDEHQTQVHHRENGVVRGSNLDDPSALVLQQQFPSSVDMGMGGPMGIQMGSFASRGSMPAPVRAPFTAQPAAAMGGMGGMGMGGLDAAVINNLTQTIGAMFANMANMDRSNPQDMIQLGLGMGMALMQTGAANNVAQGHIQQIQEPFNQHMQISSQHSQSGEDKDMMPVVNIPSFAEDQHSVFSQSQDDNADPVPTATPSAVPQHQAISREPIGRVHPTAVLSSDRMLDHHEEQQQRRSTADKLSVPLNTMEKARNLVVEAKPSETPDMVPVKAAAEAKPTNAEQAIYDESAVPLVAYPELSTMPAKGAPPTYTRKPPAGLGTRFVSREEESTQLQVPGANHLRRTVMPLPVGFFDAIEAKHVAQQAVDYLPQVPNFPQSRTIGRVKPRSAAADWLMISFDPWSAGKNPLGTEFVPSLMARADRLLKDTEGKAAETIETLNTNVLGGAFVNVQDEAGLSQQRADISKAQIMAQDFRKLCSLCRHGKFADAEQLINQPDWAVPVDFQDDQGNALLHVAAQNGSKRLVKLCLRRGASLDLQNLTGQTALHFAYGYDYKDLGQYLVDKGANDAIRNKDGLTCYEGLGARELAML